MTRLCTFQIGPHACALDVSRVREVIRPGVPTPVPRAPEGVAGVLSVRGRILTAWDLLPRLGLPPRRRPEAAFGLVLSGSLCLLADEVGQVGEPKPSRFETPPPALVSGFADLVERAYRGRRTLYLVLNADQIRP